MAKCEVCGNDYDGHGMEADGKFFCCATCASHSGNPQMRDRAESRQPLAGPG
jgi:ribosome-binding protein aMBF1 (putative translation factor)